MRLAYPVPSMNLGYFVKAMIRKGQQGWQGKIPLKETIMKDFGILFLAIPSEVIATMRPIYCAF
ncbi:MAG: hypothetical protein ABI621_17080 [Chloroflexota bacterium]